MASLKTNRLYNNGTCEKQQIVGTGKDKIGLALKEKKKPYPQKGWPQANQVCVILTVQVYFTIVTI